MKKIQDMSSINPLHVLYIHVLPSHTRLYHIWLNGTHIKVLLCFGWQLDVVEHNRHAKLVRQGYLSRDGAEWRLTNSEACLRCLVRE